MTSTQALHYLRDFNKSKDKEIYYKAIEHDLEILNILKRCIKFTDNIIAFNGTITDKNEINLLKEWLNEN